MLKKGDKEVDNKEVAKEQWRYPVGSTHPLFIIIIM